MEESLRESEEKFRLFFETTKDAVAIISQGRFIEFNQATLELLGCTEDELRSRTTGEFYLNPQDREQFLTLLEEKGFVKDYRVDFRRCDGKIVRALMTASALRDSEGNITRIHGITRDITEKLKTEDALRKSESYYKSLFENTLIPVLILEEDGTISMVNKEAERISGYSRDDLEGKLCTDFILEEDRMSVVPEGKISPENILERLEFRIIDGCGNIRNIFGTYGRIPGTEKIVASGIDITEQKRAQKRLKELLDEKETLLREIHHRVKNNLQVVSSLISLQAHGITDEKTIENLREVQNRVNSMARIHKQLYESENLAKINFKNYTEGMVPEILYSYGVMGGDIKTDIKMENIELSIETAVPLALILTEIVSNCVKHAFPEGKGEIKIELLPGEEFYTLSVSDNGVGVPEINLENPETLGLQLINALSRQIEGRIEIKAGHGTTFKIEFPADLKLK
ncbi:PAS domain S-box protein [Methanothermobacter wolfeii]|uniref:PAS domain S-box protein n=1 Tax=Methanothermobacter wolfeii TaxID=145261 RepID=UPI000945BAB7